jgi:hypothetical protein
MSQDLDISLETNLRTEASRDQLDTPSCVAIVHREQVVCWYNLSNISTHKSCHNFSDMVVSVC